MTDCWWELLNASREPTPMKPGWSMALFAIVGICAIGFNANKPPSADAMPIQAATPHADRCASEMSFAIAPRRDVSGDTRRRECGPVSERTTRASLQSVVKLEMERVR
jgi:hypothetical protein